MCTIKKWKRKWKQTNERIGERAWERSNKAANSHVDILCVHTKSKENVNEQKKRIQDLTAVYLCVCLCRWSTRKSLYSSKVFNIDPHFPSLHLFSLLFYSFYFSLMPSLTPTIQFHSKIQTFVCFLLSAFICVCVCVWFYWSQILPNKRKAQKWWTVDSRYRFNYNKNNKCE